jgi:hypothetical protein
MGGDAMSAHCSQIPAPSYYVVMRDFGVRGQEAVTDPTMTRADILKAVKPGGEWDRVVFIHFVEVGEPVKDVTVELLHEAACGSASERPCLADRLRADRVEWVNDYKRDLRKNEVA